MVALLQLGVNFLDEKLADVWFPETEEEMRSIRHSLALAEWNFVTNVTTQTEKEVKAYFFKSLSTLGMSILK